MRSSTSAVWIAAFFGPLGLHKVRLDQPVQGLLRLLFCWTSIRALLGLLDLLTMPGTIAACPLLFRLPSPSSGAILSVPAWMGFHPHRTLQNLTRGVRPC